MYVSTFTTFEKKGWYPAFKELFVKSREILTKQTNKPTKTKNKTIANPFVRFLSWVGHGGCPSPTDAGQLVAHLTEFSELI